MIILDVKNARFLSSDRSCIVCDILIDGISGYIKFNATNYDEEPHGREIYRELLNGRWGEIQPYILDTWKVVQDNKSKKSVAIESIRSKMTVYQVELSLGTISDSDKTKLIKLLAYYKEIEALDVNDINMVIPEINL